MTIKDCPNCGGTHYGSMKCPYIEAPCIVCGDGTILACSDCAINSGGKSSVHVCKKPKCRKAHDKIHAESGSFINLPTDPGEIDIRDVFGTRRRYTLREFLNQHLAKTTMTEAILRRLAVGLSAKPTSTGV